ncbi:hypothetical protein Sliba_46360 [Streptomyces nigrescens]|uniref:Uncharacterized protein n=1 Tax=Streptomyces nigrescens TaxID=1920 RepID=A0A640TJW7_STRNI|nr:hypothetical protein Sliba_46360 [Streptomyces libani subsp. libani]
MRGGVGPGGGVFSAGGGRGNAGGLREIVHVLRSSCPLDKVSGNRSSHDQWTPFPVTKQLIADRIGPDLAGGRENSPPSRSALYLSGQSFTF